jgi:two-component system chemotaxis response regulator CheY
MFPSDSKILIVDDSSFSRTIVKNGLKDLKYWKMYEAENAVNAQIVLAQEFKNNDPIQLLICDIHMPEMSGLELLKWVRARDAFKNLPVIIITSSQEKKEVVEAAKLGVSHFMIKPFGADTLKERLTAAWSKHGQQYAAEKSSQAGK